MASLHDQQNRIRHIVEDYDGQGWHRTGTRTNQHSALRLGERIKEIGVPSELESFEFTRVNPQQTFVEIDGDWVFGLPLFDGTFTGPKGICSHEEEVRPRESGQDKWCGFYQVLDPLVVEEGSGKADCRTAGLETDPLAGDGWGERAESLQIRSAPHHADSLLGQPVPIRQGQAEFLRDGHHKLHFGEDPTQKAPDNSGF